MRIVQTGFSLKDCNGNIGKWTVGKNSSREFQPFLVYRSYAMAKHYCDQYNNEPTDYFKCKPFTVVEIIILEQPADVPQLAEGTGSNPV